MGEMFYEIEKIKLNSWHGENMTHGSIHNIIHENDSLKNENKDLKERVENVVYAMGALKRDVINLEKEKKSLTSVIKLLQVDAQVLNNLGKNRELLRATRIKSQTVRNKRHSITLMKWKLTI